MATPSREILETIARNTHPSVPYAIALSVAERESKFDPNVKDGAAGEIGMFQLLPKTVREELGYNGPLEALRDPGKNTKLATEYLAKLFERFGTWQVAIRAYNGSGTAARTYAAGVLERLPTWDQFVKANLEFFKGARGALGVTLLVVGAILLLLFMAPQHGGESWET